MRAIVAALHANGAHTRTALHACGALSALARTSAHHAAIVSAGGIPAVVRVLKAHPASEGVVRGACAALALLSSDASTRAAIADTDGIDAIYH